MFVSDVNIQPNRTGLPGIASLESIVGALLTFGLVAAVAGIAISAIAWAIGSHSGNPHVAGKGKSGVLVALAAAFLIGGARGRNPRGEFAQSARDAISHAQHLALTQQHMRAMTAAGGLSQLSTETPCLDAHQVA